MEQIGLLSRQGIPVSVLIRLGIQGDLHGICPKPGDRHQRTVGIFRTEIPDRRAEIAPLSQLVGVLHALCRKLRPKTLKHLLPARLHIPGQNGCVKFHTGANADCRELFQQLCVGSGRRVALHQCVCLAEECDRIQREDLVDGNIVVFLLIAPLRGLIRFFAQVGGQRQELHARLNDIHIRKVCLAGEHSPGDGPRHSGRNIDAGHILRQVAAPIGARDRIGSGTVKDSDGIRPCVKHLHLAEAIRFRKHIDHRLLAQVVPHL